ncbi:unnamed protein product, partial [Prorocentrum cordatum]
MWRPLAPEDGRGPGGPPPPPGGRRGRLRWAPLAAAAVRMWPPILLAALAAALGPLLGGPRRAAAPARGLARLSAAGPPPPRLAVASIFAPHMVLQRGEATLLWGVASPGSGPVIVRYGAAEVRSSVDDATGHWEAKLPAMDARSEPSNLTIESTTSSLMLQDVVVGDVYLCAGGSQMQYDLPTVADALRKRGEPVDSQRQWAREHASSVRIVEVARAYRRLAQDNATLMIPWQRMDHHFRLEFGALCYFFGAEQVKSRPDVPVGLVVSAYPSTFAEQFAPPEALEECGVDISYTGKLNEWWSPKDIPMVAFQPGCGPATVHADQLRSVTAAFLQEPRTAVAVTADLCDPDRITIHSPFKELEAQRMAAIGENVIHGNNSMATSGPLPLSVSVERGPGPCMRAPECWRLRVAFDQEVGLKPTLEPQHSESPATALRRAFRVISRETAGPSAWPGRGSRGRAGPWCWTSAPARRRTRRARARAAARP